MEPNKLETHFKEQLNSREIKPSEMAWDKLDAMLTETKLSSIDVQIQKSKNNFYWLYVAASFVGLLLLGTVFLNQNSIITDANFKNNVVDNTIPKPRSRNQIEPSKLDLNVVEPILEQKNKLLVQIKKQQNNEAKKQLPYSNEKLLVEKQPQNTVESSIVTEVKTQVNIEDLLASVDGNQKLKMNTSSIKINSANLLNQVDNELQLSFREKAFNSIVQKYKEAKEVVVNRNNQ